LECGGCHCYSDTETDASDERFSQGSDYSEILGSDEASSAALHAIYTGETALADNENLTSEPPETAAASHALHTTGGTCSEGANASLHNPFSSLGTAQRTLAHSSGTVKQNETRISPAKKRVTFAPSTREPCLQSASYSNRLFETSLTSYVCETDTQSTYFSIDPNQQGSSQQITSPSHDRVHEPSSQVQSIDMFSTPSSSEHRQSQTGLKVHSQLCMSENINELSESPICPSNMNENKTCDLADVTSEMCVNTSRTGKKQAKNSKYKLNMHSSTQSPADMCSSTPEKVLKVNNGTGGHKNQNGRQTTESSAVTKNPDEIIPSSLNVTEDTKISHSTTKSQTRHKIESTLKSLANEGSQTMQNASKPSVTNTHRKQAEHLPSLSQPQKFRSECQCSECFGLTQSLMTQSQEGSFIFGIKRIWTHSAPEFVPNCQLPEGFWSNKASQVPEDLLQALENW
jgi:hypothetical protein